MMAQRTKVGPIRNALLTVALLMPLICGAPAFAQETAPKPESDASIVVNASLSLQQKQDRALADAVEAYRDLGADWIKLARCDLHLLCIDEQYTIQVSGNHVHLLFSPPSQSPIKMAAFPLSAIQMTGNATGPLPRAGTAEYNYVRLHRSLSLLSRQAIIDRQQLYRFPDPHDNPFLPWPPRIPSSFDDVTTAFRTRTTLGDIANQIRSRIKPRGYDTLRYFSVPGGFAVATDLERVGRDRPVTAADRWTSGKRGGRGSIMDYWRRLIAGENDRFRVFVFIVTDMDIQNDRVVANAGDLRHWKATGRGSLSKQRASATALPGTRIWLYAYEFNASRSKSAELIQNERDPLRIRQNKTALGLP